MILNWLKNASLTSKTPCEITFQREPTNSAFPSRQRGFCAAQNKKVAPSNPMHAIAQVHQYRDCQVSDPPWRGAVLADLQPFFVANRDPDREELQPSRPPGR
jgi:hypothetical protein